MTQNVRTISDVEDVLNVFAADYGRKKWNLPGHATKVLVWPTNSWRVAITSGPTAIIRLGCARTVSEDFRLVLLGKERKRELSVAVEYLKLIGTKLKDAVDHVAKHHLYECLSIERTVDIIRRNEDGKRFRREKFGFDEEMIPHMLHADEMIVRHVERVEVIHRESGMREIVELEMGKGRGMSVYTMLELAKARLSRAVKAAEVSPMDLDPSDPNWIARTA